VSKVDSPDDHGAKTPRKGLKQPWKPGQSGNPKGRPQGSRHKISVAVENLLDGEAETLTRKAIELALAGDLAALRICLDRVFPVRRDRPINFQLPSIASAGEASKASAAVVAAVAAGDLTPSEGGEIGKLIEGYVKTLEVTDFEERLSRLENKVASK
jgi:Family of unknown function (DUF5681)